MNERSRDQLLALPWPSMSHPHPTSEFEPRPVSPTERGVLDLLLTQEFEGVEKLRAQLRHVQVVGRCSCGCATVDLAVDRDLCEPATGRGRPILSEADVLDDAGAPRGGVIVFLTDGYLSLLEIFSYFEPIVGWPRADRLRLVLREA